ncbi:MAG: putative phosphoserine phosphatase/1-acylglycerol-3-phosphate O-acyltransferase [Myxococcota bacterium]|jgi:putative phosphoserine phosphatase/1-acylglycerol-3-phosphate O-acyltransferase
MTNQLPPRQETWQAPKPGGVWRARFFFIFSFLWCFLYLTFLALVLSIFPKKSRKWRTPLIRGWGKSMLRMFGVKLEVHGQQYRDQPRAKILLANHVSLVDLFIYSAEWADPGSVMYKQEFSKIPLFGFLMPRLGFIAVDRADRAKAHESMAAAASRINDDGVSIWMAPEGTRSRGKGLGKFKLGAFHIALATKAPIVPSVMRGLETINPGGGMTLLSGTVRIDYLPPIDTSEWQQSDMRRKSREVRNLFLRYLPPAPGTKDYDPALETDAPEVASETTTATD